MGYKVTIQKNAHILLGEDKHYYSVPYRYTGQKAKLMYTSSTVSIYVNSDLVAMQPRDTKPHGYTSVKDYMQSHYRQYQNRSPDYYEQWSSKISEHVLEAVKVILSSKKHSEQATRAVNACAAGSVVMVKIHQSLNNFTPLEYAA